MFKLHSNNTYHAAYVMSCNAHYEDGFIEYTDPHVYAQLYAKKLPPDTYQYHQAILQPDWEQFQESASLEIRTPKKWVHGKNFHVLQFLLKRKY
jgi:hypothetical protein